MELESVGGSSSIDVYVAVLFVSEKLIVFIDWAYTATQRWSGLHRVKPICSSWSVNSVPSAGACRTGERQRGRLLGLGGNKHIFRCLRSSSVQVRPDACCGVSAQMWRCPVFSFPHLRFQGRNARCATEESGTLRVYHQEVFVWSRPRVFLLMADPWLLCLFWPSPSTFVLGEGPPVCTCNQQHCPRARRAVLEM